MFAERVIEEQYGSCRMILLPTPVESVVSFGGSFETFPDTGAREELLQRLTVMLLDKGTRSRNRFEVVEVLEERGAELRFSSSELRVTYSGRVLREHIRDVLEVAVEQLTEPAFDEQEFEKTRTQLAASIRRSAEITSTQAGAALSRALFPRSHPNYVETVEEALEKLASYSVEDVRAYHRDRFRFNGHILVFAGDLDTEAIQETVERHFAQAESPRNTPKYSKNAIYQAAGRSVVDMREKSNIDVRMGHGIPVKRKDPAFLPLYLSVFVLGGNFSARLMTTIRDQMGLTYGIGASLSGISTEYEGHWQVAVTLSRENVEKGVEATMQEVRRFVDEGITDEELRTVKKTIEGSYQVGLATTRGLTFTLLHNAERGFDVSYMDTFLDEVEAVTLDQARSAIETYLHPEHLHLAYAGGLDGVIS